MDIVKNIKTNHMDCEKSISQKKLVIEVMRELRPTRNMSPLIKCRPNIANFTASCRLNLLLYIYIYIYMGQIIIFQPMACGEPSQIFLIFTYHYLHYVNRLNVQF